MRRRSVVEAVNYCRQASQKAAERGHLRNGHRMDRNYLAHEQGDAINPIMAAVGYNFRLILKWIRFLWLQIWIRWITSPSAIIA